MPFRLTSPTFGEGRTIPPRHAREGGTFSPPLARGDPPPGTRSFALFCEDEDAGCNACPHWAVFNVPADRRRLEGGLPVRADLRGGLRQAVNDFGQAGYAGPCPARGHSAHRYRFRLVALDVARLPEGPESSCRAVAEAADAHAPDAASLTGLFRR